MSEKRRGMNLEKLENFLSTALELAKKGEEAEKVLRLANGEIIKNPTQNTPPPPEYVKAVRFYAINVVFDTWNEQVRSSGEGRDIYIGDIVKPVQEKVKFLQSIGAWKWGIPSELTIRRRVEEAALPKYYPETGKPAIVSVEPTFYRPNPFYLSPQTREAIREQLKPAEILG